MAAFLRRVEWCAYFPVVIWPAGIGADFLSIRLFY